MATETDQKAAMMLTELSALFAGNLQRLYLEAGISVNSTSVPLSVLAAVGARAYAQNAELARAYAERFDADGEETLSAVCLAMEAQFNARCAALTVGEGGNAALAMSEYVSAAIGGLSAAAENISLGMTADKVLGVLDKSLTALELGEAALEGDASAYVGVLAAGMVTGAVAAITASFAVAVGIVSWPAIAAIAVVGAAAGMVGGELTDTFIEDLFVWDREPEDEREYARRLITQLVTTSGAVRLPALGDFVKFGTLGDDTMVSIYDPLALNPASILIGDAGSDTLLGGTWRDRLNGGSGSDHLDGGLDDDVLLGGAGDDFLKGGKGNDKLQGGQGFDTYDYATADFGAGYMDTIFDADGSGKIVVDDITLGDASINYVSRDGLGWETQDRAFYMQVIGAGQGQSLVIVHRDTGARIFVEGWSNGSLGITLPNLGQPGSPENPYVMTNGKDVVTGDGDDDDVFTPISGNDVIVSLAGNDGIDGGFGDDFIDGGQDNDLLLGGPGSNKLRGGLGNDVIIGASLVTDWTTFTEEWAFDPGHVDLIYADLEGRSDVFSYGDGWWVVNDVAPANRIDATANLWGLQLWAIGPTDGNPATDDIWVRPDANLYKNGDDDIDGGDGSDTLYGGEGSDTISGGADADLILGGTDGDFIAGEEGNDLILGDDITIGTSWFEFLATLVSSSANASGNDVISAGAGDDRVSGQGGNDVIDGGEGDDILAGDRIDYTVDLAVEQPVVSGDDHIDGGAGNDHIYGDGGNDVLLGGSGEDTIAGDSVTMDPTQHGDDTISGGADDDMIAGMGGDDVVRGDEGDDFLLGDADVSQLALQYHGNDSLYGGAGADQLQGGGGDDVLDGGTQNDLLFGEDGSDRLLGGDGDDQLVGGAGDDVLDGGAGNDKLWGDAGDDVLTGGEGYDELQGGDGNDRLVSGAYGAKMWGDAGDDTFIGGNVYNEMAGGAGADIFYGGSLQDIVNGNEGNDLIYTGAGYDNISGNEDNDTIYAGDGGDYLGGDEGNDALYGEAGNDTLVGGDGNDLLNGGLGDDQISGGTGDDIYRFDGEFGSDLVTGLGASDSGNDTIVLGDGISAADANIYAYGEDLIVQFGREEYGIWRNSVTLQGFVAAGGRHNVVFADGSVLLAGDAGANTLVGSAGNDNLDGQGGDDTIQAGAGDDRIIGGAGVDIAYGGAGDDAYFNVETAVEAAGEGNDTLYFRGETPDTFVLGDNVENLDILSDNINQFKTIVGNDSDNLIVLRNGSNYLTWAASMDGGAGADKYVYYGDTPTKYVTIYVDNAGDSWEGWRYALLGGGVYAGSNQFDIRSVLEADFTFDVNVREFHTYGTQAITVTGDDRDNIIGGNNNAAANTLVGGAGGDTYRVDAGDIVVEDADSGEDKIILETGTITDYTIADNVERLQSNLAGTLHGNGLNNIISFAGYVGGSIYGEGGADSLSGSYFDDSLYGGIGDDTLFGDSGNDMLDGGTGADYMNGGAGNDTYYVDSLADVIYESNDGYAGDKVFSAVEGYALAAGVESLELQAGIHAGYGSEGANTITGNAQDNILAGNGGSDTLFGGAGSDVYLYNLGDGSDYLVDDENAAGEIDVLRFGAGITTADVQVRKSVENGIYVVVNGQSISLSDGKLYSHEHDLGAASRIERIEFDDGTIWNVDEVANQAPVAVQVDRQNAFVGELFSLALPDPLFTNDAGETLDLQFDLPDWLTYDAPTRTLSGTPPTADAGRFVTITATDTVGQSAQVDFAVVIFNRINGTSGADTLTGTEYSDWILGLGGADTLDGGEDFDHLVGGAGDDTYVLGYDEDEIVELANEGNDLVKASYSYTLGENLERLTITGTEGADGVGNALDNTLTGNNAANTLEGLDGNDILDGKSGSDTMIGGLGDDTYFVERTGDAIEENVGEGYDSVSSTISYTLQDGLEKLTLTGSSGLSGTGNAADNVLIGNTGANTLTGMGGNDTLDGKSGADTLKGGLGDDTYVVDNASDSVQEAANEGIDSVESSIAHTLAANVENLTITGTGTLAGTGNALGNRLVGGSGSNALTGLAGSDTLEGKGGTDTLTGGADGDTYLMARTYGTDTVVENDAASGVVDVAKFLSGVAYDQLWFKRPSGSNNLEISIIGTTDKLVIKDWYLGSQYRVEEIRTEDGNKVLYAADVQSLVTAMAGMTPPAQGQTTLTPAQRATLDPVFATTWQNQQGLMGGNGQASREGSTGIALNPRGETPAPIATGTSLPGLSGSFVESENSSDAPHAVTAPFALDAELRRRWRYEARYGWLSPERTSEADHLIAAMAAFGSSGAASGGAAWEPASYVPVLAPSAH